MELIYTDSTGKELDFVLNANIDMEIGEDEKDSINDFEVEYKRSDWTGLVEFGSQMYVPDTEYGGIVQELYTSTKSNSITVKGYTWRGMMTKKVIQPESNQDYAVESGELNQIIQRRVQEARELRTTIENQQNLEFFKKKYIWIYFAFILFYRFAEGLVIKIVPLFLNAPLDQQGMGLTEQQIGLYYGTFGVIAFVVGSILGGYFISWLKLRRALFPLVCIFNVPFVVYALLAWFQPSSPVLICAAIVFEYFSYGFGFVGLTLFIMQQVAPGSHQMAHYAFGSSLANLGVMLPGMISGWLCDSLGGYHYFFMWALLATVPAFLLAARIPFTYPDTEEVTAEEVDKELINE